MLGGGYEIATPVVICCQHLIFAAGDTRGGADEPIEIESSSDEEVFG